MDNPYQSPATSLTQPVSDDGDIFEHAPRWRRLVAFLIDFAIGCLAAAATGGAVMTIDAGVSDEMLGLYVILAGLLVHVLINLSGWSTTGQSIGKRILKIRIVRKDMTTCSLKRILIPRTIVSTFFTLVPFIGFFWPLVDGLLIFRRKPHCLHDDLSGTAVIRC